MAITETAIEKRWQELVDEYNTDADFMQPMLYHGPLAAIEMKDGSTLYVPAEYADDVEDRDTDEPISITETYYARLSASGYLDCTDYEPLESVSDVDDFFSRWFD